MWTSAFTIFIAISAEHQATSHEVGGLLTYMNEIKNMAKEGYDFLTYDHHYRLERSYRSDKPSWDMVNQPLQNTILRKGKIFRNSQSSQKQSKFSSKFSNLPKGYCFNYHVFGKPCLKKPCPHSHACYKCGKGEHKASGCSASGAHDAAGDRRNRNNHSNKE